MNIWEDITEALENYYHSKESVINVLNELQFNIHDNHNKVVSDLEEAIIYPLQGASIGASYSGGNPWGALGGALYGLAYSFKEDLGLKDSNFLTQLIFPIGMGDSGGLRIGNKPILDLG